MKDAGKVEEEIKKTLSELSSLRSSVTGVKGQDHRQRSTLTNDKGQDSQVISWYDVNS